MKAPINQLFKSIRMKKSFLLIAAAVATLTASAQTTYGVQPPQGDVDVVEVYTAGVGSIEFTGVQATINRDCEGFVELIRDGEVLSRVPASNMQRVFCIDGMDKVTLGNPHVTFYTDQASSRAKYNGSYTVTVPTGLFFIDGDPSKPNIALTLQYTVSNGKIEGDSLEPAENSTVKSISKIVMKFADASSVSYTDNSGYEQSGEAQVFSPAISLYTGNPEDGAFPTVSCDGASVTLTFDPEVSTPGIYRLGLKAGCLTITNNDGTTRKNGDAVYYYNIKGTEESIYKIFPEEGNYELFASGKISPAEKYGYFKIEYPEDYQIGLVLMQAPALCPLDAAGNYSLKNYYCKFKVLKNGNPANSVILASTIPSEQDKETTIAPPAGKYALVVPKQAYQVKDASGKSSYNTEMVFYYEVSGVPAEVVVTPSDEQAVTELSEIVLTFPETTRDASGVVWNPGYYAYITNGPTEYALTGVVNGRSVTLTIPAPIKENGEWVLNIPSQALTVDGNPTAITRTYTVDNINNGIESIVDAPADNTIYSVSGVRVANGNDLQPGIYIVGGKKVVVK